MYRIGALIMTWIVEPELSQAELAAQFQSLMMSESIIKIPGAHDGMAGLVAKKIGFQAIYLSGAAFTASQGLPDLGIIQSCEMASKAREIIRATNLPLLVDIDTGYGGILNVARAAKEMTEARVAAVQIEDQDLPKKCGHLNGKKLVPSEDMMQKISAIKEICPTLFVVARTDARAIEGFDAALERAHKYVQAGADAIFPEALTEEQEFRTFAQHLNVPLLANMTEFGKTPYFTAEQFHDCGYQMVIYPVTSLRVAAKAYEMVFTELMTEGTQVKRLDTMQTRQELYDIIEYNKYESLDSKISKTILPDIGREQG